MRKTPFIIMLLFILVVAVCGASPQENVTIKIIGSNKELTIKVPKDIVELKLTKTRSMLPVLRRVEGLDQLPSLRKLDLSFTVINEKTDILFFSQATHLEELRLGFMKIKNFDFLRYLPNIMRVVDYDFVEIGDKKLVIDLNNNQKIERIDVGTSELVSIPMVVNQPSSFRILNLARNHIDDLNSYHGDKTLSYKIVLSDSEYSAIKDRKIENVFSWSSMRDHLGE